ncbi:MAG: hypothetical protein JWM20_75 [Patescibacteria group bacterium]|nr:hypothetical protein [Patescibacteria group bacterium]
MPGWEDILANLISKEENCNFLREMTKKKNFEKFEQLFKKRILEIMGALEKPTPFFMECIWNHSFFGDRDLFFKKMNDLVK